MSGLLEAIRADQLKQSQRNAEEIESFKKQVAEMVAASGRTIGGFKLSDLLQVTLAGLMMLAIYVYQKDQEIAHEFRLDSLKTFKELNESIAKLARTQDVLLERVQVNRDNIDKLAPNRP